MGRPPKYKEFETKGTLRLNRGFNRPWARNAPTAKVPRWETIQNNKSLYEPLRLTGKREQATKNAIYAHLYGKIADFSGCPRGDPTSEANEYKCPFRDCVTGRPAKDENGQIIPGCYECTNCYYINDNTDCVVTIALDQTAKPIVTNTARAKCARGERKPERKSPTTKPKMVSTNEQEWPDIKEELVYTSEAESDGIDDEGGDEEDIIDEDADNEDTILSPLISRRPFFPAAYLCHAPKEIISTWAEEAHDEIGTETEAIPVAEEGLRGNESFEYDGMEIELDLHEQMLAGGDDVELFSLDLEEACNILVGR